MLEFVAKMKFIEKELTEETDSFVPQSQSSQTQQKEWSD